MIIYDINILTNLYTYHNKIIMNNIYKFECRLFFIYILRMYVNK